MDSETLLALKKRLLSPGPLPTPEVEPVENVQRSGNPERIQEGLRLIREGKVGALLIAGGQGTRLGFEGPKGAYPISPVHGKSLFRLFAEKTWAASQYADRPLPLAVMTSPLNHEETIAHFKKHDSFGLKSSQLFFFRQGMLPFLDDAGEVFEEEEGKTAKGPDGNGYSLKVFSESGILDLWLKQGIEYVNFVLVDNPLAEPFDPELPGALSLEKNDAVIKCVERTDPAEKVGVIVKLNGKPGVIEYTELPEEERKKEHPFANISLFGFSIDFVKRAAQIELPLHLARKNAVKEGKTIKAWKFERFIFDLLPHADRVEIIAYPREECFAPLKNREGKDNPETVKKALLAKDRRIYEAVKGKPAPDVVEVPPEWYFSAYD